MFIFIYSYKESKYAKAEREHAERKAEEAKALENRPLQKAKVTTEEDAGNNTAAFKPFSGAPKRIDGKVPTSMAQAKQSNEALTKETDFKNGGSMSSKLSGAVIGDVKGMPSDSKSSSGSLSGQSSSAKLETSEQGIAAPQYESRIGDKYSKKKTSVAAFTGQARKLGGGG